MEGRESSRELITITVLSTILGIKVIHGILRDRLGVPEFKTAMYISFMHALVTGVGAYYIFWQTWTEFPLDMLKLKYFEIPGAEIVITMSIGYFFYDTIDVAIWSQYEMSLTGRLDYLLHHVAPIGAFGLILFTKSYQGGAILSLLVELNSTFLHGGYIAKNYWNAPWIVQEFFLWMELFSLIWFRHILCFRIVYGMFWTQYHFGFQIELTIFTILVCIVQRVNVQFTFAWLKRFRKRRSSKNSKVE